MNEENTIKLNICNTIDKWLNEHPRYNNSSFAKLLNVSDTSVRRWRAGICLPDISLLPAICDIMGISVLSLLGLDNTKALAPDEQRVIKEYQTNPDFKVIVSKYLNDENFKSAINSIAKLPR